MKFMTGHQPDGSIVPIGEPWREEEDTDPKPAPGQTVDSGTKGEGGEQLGEDGGRGETEGKGATLGGDKEFRGDRTLARSVSFMYEALVSKEVAQAVAEGDVGRVYEGIKVSLAQACYQFSNRMLQMMLFTFAGSSHTKYTGYLLDTIGFLEFDAGQELRTMFLRNWLVNPSGEACRYLEKDLMQEHHNEVLEERSKRQGTSWDSRQMRDVHSRTVQHVERIKKELRPALTLAAKGWKHTKPHDRPEVKILLDVYCSTQLHTFRRGRQYRSSACFVDEFSRGTERLETKLDKWKADLGHSDLMATTTLKTPNVLAPDDETDGDDKVGDVEKTGDGEEEDVAVGVPQTEGHREFVGGELHMVNDEVGHGDEDGETNI